ncbi:MAG: hypothetical protein R6W73_07120 [Candidatus Saliniplasma sp.]
MEKKNIGAMGFSMGLIFGGGVWLATSVMLGTEFTVFLIQGVGAGIIIGSACALGLIKGWFGRKEALVMPFGMGWGTMVGIVIGLLAAWSVDLSYLTGFSVGASAGFISGLLIASMLWISTKRT